MGLFGKRISITSQMERVSGVNGSSFQSDREDEILDSLAPGRDLSGDITDRWSGMGNEQSVSIEGAGYRELELKDVKDGELVVENMGWDTSAHKGLVPCDLLKKVKSEKKGRHGSK